MCAFCVQRQYRLYSVYLVCDSRNVETRAHRVVNAKEI
jgi:hypothetical protein